MTPLGIAGALVAMMLVLPSTAPGLWPLVPVFGWVVWDWSRRLVFITFGRREVRELTDARR